MVPPLEVGIPLGRTSHVWWKILLWKGAHITDYVEAQRRGNPLGRMQPFRGGGKKRAAALETRIALLLSEKSFFAGA